MIDKSVNKKELSLNSKLLLLRSDVESLLLLICSAEISHTSEKLTLDINRFKQLSLAKLSSITEKLYSIETSGEKI